MSAAVCMVRLSTDASVMHAHYFSCPTEHPLNAAAQRPAASIWLLLALVLPHAMSFFGCPAAQHVARYFRWRCDAVIRARMVSSALPELAWCSTAAVQQQACSGGPERRQRGRALMPLMPHASPWLSPPGLPKVSIDDRGCPGLRAPCFTCVSNRAPPLRRCGPQRQQRSNRSRRVAASTGRRLLGPLPHHAALAACRRHG